MLVADGNTTSAVSPTRRGARPKYQWTAESPTKRVYTLARLSNKHNHRRSWVHTENTGLAASMMDINMSYTKHENGRRSPALLGKHDQAHLEQHSNSPASSEAMSTGRCRVLVPIPPAPLLSQPPKVRFFC